MRKTIFNIAFSTMLAVLLAGCNAAGEFKFLPNSQVQTVSTRVATTSEIQQQTAKQQPSNPSHRNKAVKKREKVVDRSPALTATPQTRRINTTQCADRDDWYLDGYRVGKSFTAQKSAMLQQRLDFCRGQSLPSGYQESWQRGYDVGKTS